MEGYFRGLDEGVRYFDVITQDGSSTEPIICKSNMNHSNF